MKMTLQMCCISSTVIMLVVSFDFHQSLPPVGSTADSFPIQTPILFSLLFFLLLFLSSVMNVIIHTSHLVVFLHFLLNPPTDLTSTLFHLSKKHSMFHYFLLLSLLLLGQVAFLLSHLARPSWNIPLSSGKTHHHLNYLSITRKTRGNCGFEASRAEGASSREACHTN